MSDLAGAILKGYATWERKPSDMYPTPAEATQALIDFLRPAKNWRIREPACGDGDMSRVLHANGYEVESFDLRFTGYGQGGVDFLKADLPRTDIVMTNPPFSVAEAFIRRALGQAPVVCMLLKSNYFHTKRGRKLWMEHPPTFELKLTWRLAFLKKERGNSPLMDCSWFVWLPVKAGERVEWDGIPAADTFPVLKPAKVPDISLPPLAVALRRLDAALAGLHQVIEMRDL